MEITKTEKIDLSQIAVRSTARNPLSTRILALDVGEAFVVEGVDREALRARIYPLRKEGRKLITTKLGFGKFRVVRIA